MSRDLVDRLNEALQAPGAAPPLRSMRVSVGGPRRPFT
jgi:hypothetical protein